MSDRKPWSKFWDMQYLADQEMNALSFRERAIVHLLWSISRTQMDEPGVFIRKGNVLDASSIAASIRHFTRSHQDRKALVSSTLEALLRGPFAQREDGAWYSPRIVREHETHEKQAAYGRKGAKAQGKAVYYSGDDTDEQTPRATPRPTPRVDAEADADKRQSRAEGPLGSTTPEPPAARTPIGKDMAQQAELERRFSRWRTAVGNYPIEESDWPILQRVVSHITSDRVSGKPLPIHQRLKILDEFQRFEPEVMFRACIKFEQADGIKNGKGPKYLLSICDGGATSEYLEERALREKRERGEVDAKRTGPVKPGAVLASKYAKAGS